MHLRCKKSIQNVIFRAYSAFRLGDLSGVRGRGGKEMLGMTKVFFVPQYPLHMPFSAPLGL